MKLDKMTKEMALKPVILEVALYSKADNTYCSDDKQLYIQFPNWTTYENYKKSMTPIIKEQEVHYYKKGNCIIAFNKRYSLHSWVALKAENRFELEPNYAKKSEKLHKIIKGYWVEYRAEDAAKKKAAGFVNYTYPMKAKEVYGNLNLLLTPHNIKYIGEGSGVFGYLGHSWRQFYMDDYMEYCVAKVQKAVKEKNLQLDVVTPLAMWLNHSEARHWMDSREDTNKNEFKAAFKKRYSDLLYTEYHQVDVNTLFALRKIIDKVIPLSKETK